MWVADSLLVRWRINWARHVWVLATAWFHIYSDFFSLIFPFKQLFRLLFIVILTYNLLLIFVILVFAGCLTTVQILVQYLVKKLYLLFLLWTLVPFIICDFLIWIVQLRLSKMGWRNWLRVWFYYSSWREELKVCRFYMWRANSTRADESYMAVLGSTYDS